MLDQDFYKIATGDTRTAMRRPIGWDKAAKFSAASVWQEPDCGMWERRGPRKHYVSSKVLTWVAGMANDLGLLSEEFDLSANRQIGNFPQALTHPAGAYTHRNHQHRS